MKIVIAADHAGYKLKKKIINYLKEYEVIDVGTDSEESVDYPDYAKKLCQKILNKEADFGITICYTGIGMSIACNRYKNIRCSKVNSCKEAKLTREHNNSNVLALSARMPFFKVKSIIKTYLKTNYSNEKRHERRISKLDEN